MGFRTRSRVLQGPRVPGSVKVTTLSTGAIQTLGDSTGIQDRRSQTTSDTTSDHPPPWTVPHFFATIDRRVIQEPMVDGSYQSAGKQYDLHRWSNTDFDGWPDTSVESGIPSMNELALKAIANLNPNVPDVDLPLFLFELRELPKLLKFLGDFHFHKTSSSSGAVLAYQMGIKPLISDLQGLIGLAALTEKRMEYIRQLADGHRVKRKLGKGTGAQVWSTKTWPSISGIQTSRYDSTEWQAWYTAEVSATLTLPQLNDLPTLVLETALGLNGPSLSSAWNAIPWSWLIDYFFTFGTWLEAQRGYIPFKFKNLCVMRRSVATRRIQLLANPHGLAFTEGLLENEHKRREVFQTLPMFGPKMRILSASQVLTLSSLVLARSKQARDLASTL